MTTARICIVCDNPITFDYVEIPIEADRHRRVATFYAHFDAESCAAERARHAALDAHDPAANDIGQMRAAELRAVIQDCRKTAGRSARGTL